MLKKGDPVNEFNVEIMKKKKKKGIVLSNTVGENLKSQLKQQLWIFYDFELSHALLMNVITSN